MGNQYIMSDIHGSRERFFEMLNVININFSEDVLYINGDIVDRGKDSLKFFFEIINMRAQYGENHIKILKGNHEHFLEKYLHGIMPKECPAEFTSLGEGVYGSRGYGGADTIREVKALSDDEKIELFRLLGGLKHYEIIKSPIRDEIVLVHSGLHYNYIIKNEDGSVNVIKSIEAALSANENDYLICGYLQREAPAWITKNLDYVMCVGHVPTMFIDDIQMPVITMKKGGKVIMTDCGAGFVGGRLGCIRVEDERTFYVD